MNKLTFQEIIQLAQTLDIGINDFAYNDYQIDELGEVKEMVEARQGGEGKGENWVRVYHFKDHDVYIKAQGFYQSYNGVEFYDEWDSFSEVKPSQRTITVYESK